MAPMAIDPPSLKRTSTTAELETPVAKKQNLGNLRHHQPTWDLNRLRKLDPPCLEEDLVHSLLTRAIALALNAVGFEAAEPLAIESFGAETQECRCLLPISDRPRITLTQPDMTRFLRNVQLSMLSSRRTQAIPQDFLQSLHSHRLSLRSLIPHLDPPIPPSQSQFSFNADSTTQKQSVESTFPGPALFGITEAESRSYVPNHFPPFPSMHTYKMTPEVPERVNDPRKIRELAIEDGRTAEQALRRVLGAGSDSTYTNLLKKGAVPMITLSRRDKTWQETMLAVAQESDMRPQIVDDDGDPSRRLPEKGAGSNSEGRYLSTAVNADRRHWRRCAFTKDSSSGRVNEIN